MLSFSVLDLTLFCARLGLGVVGVGGIRAVHIECSRSFYLSYLMSASLQLLSIRLLQVMLQPQLVPSIEARYKLLRQVPMIHSRFARDKYPRHGSSRECGVHLTCFPDQA